MKNPLDEAAKDVHKTIALIAEIGMLFLVGLALFGYFFGG